MLVCGGWGWGVDGGWMPLSQTEKDREKHITQGYNIAADRWTGASNPHPHPNPNPHTQAFSTHVFPLFDRQTDRLFSLLVC